MIRQKMPGVRAREIQEVFRPGDPGYWFHPEWEELFPWLAQGTTGRRKSEGVRVRSFARFTDPPARGVRHAWAALASQVEFPKVAHARQVHGKSVTVYERLEGSGVWEEIVEASGDDPNGRPTGEGRMILGPDADGHITASEGLLLGVTVADCVPISMVDPERRVVAMLHAGWKGTAVGVLDRGLKLLAEEFSIRPEELYIHLGPAVCGDCYEVGPEVHAALGLPPVAGPSPVDLRMFLAGRAVELGAVEAKVTRSSWCTLCADAPFFSHRRGDKARQVGFIGIKPSEEG
jgi:YfiH family protein